MLSPSFCHEVIAKRALSRTCGQWLPTPVSDIPAWSKISRRSRLQLESRYLYLIPQIKQPSSPPVCASEPDLSQLDCLIHKRQCFLLLMVCLMPALQRNTAV